MILKTDNRNAINKIVFLFFWLMNTTISILYVSQIFSRLYFIGNRHIFILYDWPLQQTYFSDKTKISNKISDCLCETEIQQFIFILIEILFCVDYKQTHHTHT